MNKQFFIKFFFLFFIILILIPPINNIANLLILIFCIYILFSCKVSKKYKINYKYFLLFITSYVFCFVVSIKDIEEAHSIFLTKKDLAIINEIIPSSIISKMNDSLKKLDVNRYISSHDGQKFSSKENFLESQFIEKSYAFSVDNFFYNSEYSRKVNSINFNTREQLKIGHINTLEFNIAFDNNLRRHLPYYVLYNIPSKYQGSKICGSGNIFYSYINSTEKKNFKNKNFKKLFQNDSYDCINLDEKFMNLIVIGFSINKMDPLTITLDKNFTLRIFDTIKILLILIIIFIFIKIFFERKNNFSEISLFFVLSFICTSLFTFFKDSNLIFGLRYFRGGADGLLNSARSQEIIYNLKNLDFLEALKGGSEIFYYMPGLRYFGSISNILFGDTSYGYLIIVLLLPLFLYKLIKNITNKKIATITIFSFLFFPIFENMGFGHFNYIHQVVRNHSETLSITIIIFCLSIFSQKKFIEKSSGLEVFFYAFFLSMVTFVRPNFFPAVSIITIYLLYAFHKKGFKYFLIIALGYSFNFASTIHNVYYGNSFALFTQSNIHFIFQNAYQEINNIKFNHSFIVNQILKWNPIYNLHRILMLIFVIYNICKYKSNAFILFLFLACLSQHGVLLLTHPDSRYAYLAWLLTIILFIFFLGSFLSRKFNFFKN